MYLVTYPGQHVLRYHPRLGFVTPLGAIPSVLCVTSDPDDRTQVPATSVYDFVPLCGYGC